LSVINELKRTAVARWLEKASHDLRTAETMLSVELCCQVDPAFERLREIAIQLTDYAVTDRYPDNWREIPVTEAEAAVAAAVEAMTFIKEKVGNLIGDQTRV